MKVIYGDIMSLNEYLYIPHGSDERTLSMLLSIFSKVFISHMVQMKAILRFSANLSLKLFISHMVQMKV